MKRTNRILLTVVLLVFACTNIFAYDCEVNGIYYNRISVDEFEVTSGTNKYAGDIVIPETVEYREKQFKVVQIGSNAFKDCTSLTSVIIPQGITSLPDNIFSGCTCLTNVSIPQSVNTIGVKAFYNCQSLASVEIPAAVTAISDYLFYGCSKLASVTLPQGITSIGEYAFSDCSSLVSLNLSNQVASIAQFAFHNCSGLTTLGLPEELKTIGSSAFYNCSRLETVSIPKTLTSIGKNAYYNCTSLKKVIIKDMSAWCKIAFASAESNPLHYAQRLYSDENTEIKDFYIHQKITSIGNYAFYNAEYLSRIYIMNSTPPSIGANTFGNTCYTWTDVYVPKGAKENYQNASYWSNFKAIAEHEYNYNNIKINGINYSSRYYNSSYVEVIKYEDAPYSGDISIPETITFFGKVYSVTAIGANAFQDCTELTSVVIPQSVTLIRDSAFQNCTGLTSIKIPASVKEIGNDAFKDCTGLTKVIVPDIAAWCRILFKGESNGLWSWSYANPLRYARHLYADNDTEIKKLIIPNEVTYISEHAFSDCSYIESVTIPNSVTFIGEAAFRGCTSLTSVTIPNSVTQINKYAFSGCSSLETVTLSENITRINDNLFYYCTSLKNITIPQSVTYIAYQSFCECKSLTTITIPSKVSYIGFSAFSGCSKLNTVVSLCETPPTLGKSNGQEIVFGNSSQAYLLVPQGCKENYLNYGQDSMNKRWGTYSFSGIFEFEPNKGEYLVLYSSLGGKIVYEGQEISNGADAYMVSNGESISLKIIADDGYELSACKIDGDSIKEITRESDNTYSITLNADRGHHVDAYFALKMYEGRILSIYSNNCYLYYRVLPNNELEVCRGYNSHDAMYYYAGGNVVIPDSVVFPATLSHPQREYKVTSIDKFAFMDDTGRYSNRNHLLSVVVGNNITTINDSTFRQCPYLTSVTLGNKVKSIGAEAFAYCGDLTSVNIPNSTIAIGRSAFSNCEGLTSISIPKNLTSIGNEAFFGCNNISSLKVESGNTVYDSRNNCNAIIETSTNTLIMGCKTSIVPNGVTSIGNYAFNNCEGLTEITIPNSVTNIGNYAFNYCPGLTEITIPNSVTSIGTRAFSYCENLRNIIIHNGITQIMNNTFECCTNLTNISLPNGITKIGSSAFRNCVSLSSITIPKSVTSIGNRAFFDCTSLSEVVSLNPTPPTISSNTFTEYTATLQVPIGCKEAYQNANYWSNFVNIEEIETAVSGDANNDGVVDVADVVAIVNYILNKPGENFNEKAADVNGDGVIDVADVVAVVNIILKGGNANSPEAKAHARAYLKAHGFIVP